MKRTKYKEQGTQSNAERATCTLFLVLCTLYIICVHLSHLWFITDDSWLKGKSELFEVGDEVEVLVAVVLVLAAHTPDESVVAGGSSRMDGPFR